MNPAYKHLETKLRIFELTLGQWLGILVGLAAGIVWGRYVSPFGGAINLAMSVYVAGIPVLLTFLSSQSDFDMWLRVRSLVQWRRRRERYRPGGGTPQGYAIGMPEMPDRLPQDDGRLVDLDPVSLWD